ncbi:hypothetical protein SD10_08855 [Spirosoma radiotolerans]|uniref:Glycosyltransferase RgtA/B/C/D-like domain-containing protein n=2 Tax=Spirosoma radiotolerans TaxID=1379870 RepID=A0A0E3VAP1_9BACT|nr:hypothetical protein SD10_08855 [Spirosoma radiotolerans]
MLPILVFGLIWQQYAVNIPKWDDHALRHFLFNVDQEPTVTGKFYQLFKQHNEHRIVFDRLASLLDYQLFGQLNYVHLMLVGNLSLVGLLWIFVAALRRSRPAVSGQSALYAVPIGWLLFNLSQWENMFWGMAALQNFSVVLWVIAAFYFLSYTTHWRLAFVAGVLATITSGNGLMVWPLGFLILLLRLPAFSGKDNRTSLGPIIGWLAGAAFVVALYFTGFEKPDGVKYVRPGILELSKGWFAVIGAAAEALPFNSPLRTSIVLGGLLTLVIVGIVGWGLLTNRLVLVNLFRRLLSPKTATGKPATGLSSMTVFFWSCAAFILGTSAVVAWARTGAGIDLLITSRYKMYSLTGLALVYLYGAALLPKPAARWWLIGGIASSVFFAALSYFAFLNETIWWRHWLTTNQFNWTHSSSNATFSLDSVSRRYTPPTPAFYDEALPVIYGPVQQTPVAVGITKIPGGYTIKNTTVPTQGLGDAGAYLMARSAKRTYLFPVWQQQQSMVKAHFSPDHLFTNGFESTILSAETDAGTYQLFVLIVSNANTYELRPTNQTIVSSGPPTTVEAKNW